ncbi:hypothetical protein J132_04971 [Termitomyces sp. J132]|nr:hypothetical protein H2248_011892 [Termitomyces sp. 'cryptogamus']KNZ77604.1 hypothetical protein J132_04971 [Termitomyces sp. J132]
MASFIARRATSNLRSFLTGYNRRALHNTPTVLKKKPATEIEDLFSDEVVEDSIPSQLVARKKSAGVAQAVAKPAPEASSSKASLVATPGQKKSRKLSEKDRLARFNQIVGFMTPRLGRNSTAKMPMVRNSAWVQLVQLATTEQQLETVTGMFSGWTETGHKFEDSFSELFVRRCEELKCPLFALKVYGDFAKYNLPLSLPAARQLLHSLHQAYPIETVMTAASLYDAYNLPSVSEDLVSASLVASACFRHNTKHSITVANLLVPQIKGLLGGHQPKPRPAEEGTTTQAQASNPGAFSEKPSTWLKWTFKKIDKATYTQTGKRDRAIRRWRERSGHIVAPASF